MKYKIFQSRSQGLGRELGMGKTWDEFPHWKQVKEILFWNFLTYKTELKCIDFVPNLLLTTGFWLMEQFLSYQQANPYVPFN